MKFVVKVFENKWNGKQCSTGRQVKQKTFEAKDWSEAESFAYRFYRAVEYGCMDTCSYSLSSK